MIKTVILYTMDGCPHCTHFKKMLKEENISFDERNISQHEQEYKQFVKATKNEYLPAFTLLEIGEDKKPRITLNAPDDNFEDLKEAVKIVKDFIL